MKYLLILLLFGSIQSFSQTYRPDLQNINLWTLSGRTIETINKKDTAGIKFNEDTVKGMYLLKNYFFSEGSIEFDVKGRDILQKSFVGLAFHYQNDSTYDAVYFRPFNFQNADTLRRLRAVQYISMPGFYWNVLRNKFPNQYEKKVSPVPDPNSWFHVYILIKGKNISVFVNNAKQPSLVVEKLSSTKTGQIALWVDFGSDGSFANLKIKKRK